MDLQRILSTRTISWNDTDCSIERAPQQGAVSDKRCSSRTDQHPVGPTQRIPSQQKKKTPHIRNLIINHATSSNQSSETGSGRRRRLPARHYCESSVKIRRAVMTHSSWTRLVVTSLTRRRDVFPRVGAVFRPRPNHCGEWTDTHWNSLCGFESITTRSLRSYALLFGKFE